MKKKFGIVGNPVKHSLSPVLHNYWFEKYGLDADYRIFEAEDKDLKSIIDKIRNHELTGINVTLPFKQKIINQIDKIINDAELTGSVNTVLLDKNKVIGENTDVYGLQAGYLKEIDNFKNLPSEVEARWNLWETAISLNLNPNLLEISTDFDSNQLFIFSENRRQNITSSKNALNGYQKSKCFYCAKPISIESGNENSCDVDHFFPHILKDYGFFEVDQIWNLVLACKVCNRGTGGKFEKIPDIKYLYALNKRNNHYIESHLPLRETLINQTGKGEDERKNFLQQMFDNSINHIPVKWKPNELLGEPL